MLRPKLACATAVLVIIGPHWLEILKQRASAADIDHVREEVRLALAADCTVVPVTVGNAVVPSEALERLTALNETKGFSVEADRWREEL